MSNKTFNGSPCRRCSGTERYLSNTVCVNCARKRSKNRDKEGHKALCKDYYERKADILKDKARQRYEADPDTIKARRKEYCQKHKDKVKVLTQSRLSKRRGATPPWLTKEDKAAIRKIYKEARELTRITGIEFHVDHIHPLNGKEFSGLHVPWNLQILEADKNLRKSNKL